jgi:flagellum-specific ATP synthase
LINIGAYVAGTNKDIDEALRLMPKIKKFLIQDLYEKVVWEQIKTLMKEAIS